MAGPLNGLGGQQIPFANTFQPSRNEEQVRPREDQQPQADRVQPRSAASAESQESRETGQDELEQRLSAALSDAQANGRDEVRRGSVVDITV